MRNPFTAVFALVLTCGCASTTGNQQSDGIFYFTLQASERNLGKVGSGMMTAQGDRTVVMLTVGGVPPLVSRPVRLYTFVYAGTCAQHTATPAFELNEIVNAGLLSNSSNFGPFTLEKVIPLPVSAIRSSNYAIVVRTSPADGNFDIFCGEMK
jgi:hypothetical protein